MSCEPDDSDGDHLIEGLLEAFGSTGNIGVDELYDAVWALAPQQVCFALDDVHEVPTGSEGAALLARLVSDLPGNCHLVMASRDAVPVPVARLAASGQLDRIQEADLVFDEGELDAFAEARHVDPLLLASTGGWPALAELTASAGADLVLDYLWEEVLDRVGRERAELLACFAAVGGGDDRIASALAGRKLRVDDLVAGVPLVHRTAAGVAALHPLWAPSLRSLLDRSAVDEARRRAAEVHRQEHRLHEAIDLLAESDAWDGVLELIREAETTPALQTRPADFGRWHRMLPAAVRQHPVAQLAAGLAMQPHAPIDSIPAFQAAATGFRQAGDVEGEVAAIGAHGLVLWWANDPLALLPLLQRVTALAATGSDAARFLGSFGLAAIAHLRGDSAGVFAALADCDGTSVTGWLAQVHWYRSVAHRRDGDLDQSLAELDAVPEPERAANDLLHARLRTRWLLGEVNEVLGALPALCQRFEESGSEFNASGVELEIVAKRAWLGDPDAGLEALARKARGRLDLSSPMSRTMRLVTEPSVAIARGEEARAADLLRDDAIGMIGQPDGWYWRDRAAVALVYVLVPDTRPAWEAEPLGPPHLVGLALAKALEASRAGHLDEVAHLGWPTAGVVRAHLPLPWIVELAAAGRAAGNPPPNDLLLAIETHLRGALRALRPAGVAGDTVVAEARRWLRELPAVPTTTLRIGVLGPLEVTVAGATVDHADLRRQRVRELLCFLVVRRRARREEISDALWPEHDDRGRNLRVTLSYLQRVLQPDRADGEAPYHLRSEGPWLLLSGLDHLEVDLWELDAVLDRADESERRSHPADALESYRQALPLWRGEPLADVPYADWAQGERVRLLGRYVRAALRAGELLLAAGSLPEASAAAERAIAADATLETAYQLLARARLADGDPIGARAAINACQVVVAELGLEPDTGTLALLTR